MFDFDYCLNKKQNYTMYVSIHSLCWTTFGSFSVLLYRTSRAQSGWMGSVGVQHFSDLSRDFNQVQVWATQGHWLCWPRGVFSCVSEVFVSSVLVHFLTYIDPFFHSYTKFHNPNQSSTGTKNQTWHFWSGWPPWLVKTDSLCYVCAHMREIP